VKEIALAAHLPLHQPEKIRAPEVQRLLERLSPDFIAIIAYGQIIPARLLSIPKHGWINLHASLLPKYRGASPINWAIVNGETKTGLTTMRIDAGMDTGDMLLQREIDIGHAETAPELAARMSEAGAPLIEETLRVLAAGKIIRRPQNHAEATLAPILKKEDGRIDWHRPAQEIYNRMRGFTPWPGSYSTFRGQTCHLWGRPEDAILATADATTGQILHRGKEICVLCGESTSLDIKSVQMEGRKKLSAIEFANGARIANSDRFV
jgi:methionyl-tRNA formyltransferase